MLLTISQSDILFNELSDYDLKGISESHLNSTISDIKEGNLVLGILKVFYVRP